MREKDSSPNKGQSGMDSGSTVNLFRLIGVEEGHHSIFVPRRADESMNTVATPRVEYNADQAEFLALQWRIRFAKEQGLPTETIDILEDTLRQAKNYRRQMRDSS